MPDTYCQDISQYGITGTPVIDPATNTLYAVTETQTVSSPFTYFHELHAVDITTVRKSLGVPYTLMARSPYRDRVPCSFQLTRSGKTNAPDCSFTTVLSMSLLARTATAKGQPIFADG